MNIESVTPAFAAALVVAQASIEGAVKGKTNPAFRSKYADLGACWDACREALHQNGIAVLQFPAGHESGSVGLRTILVYGPTGETMSEVFAIPLKDATNPQAAGSALTYARRYALCSVIGICPEDDDGNKASQEASQKAAPKSLAVVAQTVQSYRKTFDSKKSSDSMKAVYSEVKASDLPDDIKAALLSDMAEVIKSAKNKESGN